jgi:hypothetical protein
MDSRVRENDKGDWIAAFTGMTKKTGITKEKNDRAAAPSMTEHLVHG